MTSFRHYICDGLVILAMLINAIVFFACPEFKEEFIICGVLSGNSSQSITKLTKVNLRNREYISVFYPTPKEKGEVTPNRLSLIGGQLHLVSQNIAFGYFGHQES